MEVLDLLGDSSKSSTIKCRCKLIGQIVAVKMYDKQVLTVQDCHQVCIFLLAVFPTSNECLYWDAHCNAHKGDRCFITTYMITESTEIKPLPPFSSLSAMRNLQIR